MKRKQLIKQLRTKLMTKHEELVRIVMKRKHSDLPEVKTGDEGDTALYAVEKEILFELTNNEKAMLDAIEAALRKMDKKTYGICELCQKDISIKRLKATPWARYCLSCQRKLDSMEQ